jgi:mono/diheme cytochrome c family protein
MTNFSFRLRARRNWVIRSFIAAIFLALSLASISQEVDKPKEAPHAAAGHTGTTVGAQVFHARCISCHDKQPADNSPFGPPNLFNEFKRKSITHSQAEMVIVHGKSTMPPFGTVLSKGEIQSVIEYLNKGK